MEGKGMPLKIGATEKRQNCLGFDDVAWHAFAQ